MEFAQILFDKGQIFSSGSLVEPFDRVLSLAELNFQRITFKSRGDDLWPPGHRPVRHLRYTSY